MKKRSGFTLIELLIVMAVIAILVGIAVPAFRGMQEEAKGNRTDGDLHVLKAALESYYTKNNRYPAAATYQADIWAATPKVVDQKNYYDPYGATATTQYSYILSTNNKNFVCFSIGKDGAADITGISDAGVITPATGADDDKYVSNGAF